MVFPGTLSRGCTRCRKRRVKCDGRRPGCERCEKYKAPCPGYDRPLAVRYYGKPGETLEREKPKDSSTSSGAEYKEGGPVGGMVVRFQTPELIAPVLRQPQPSLEEESLTFFLHEYCVYPSPGVLRGHFDFLEGMYRNSDPKKYYGAALHSVNRDLSVSNRASLKEETLTSLMLLGIIEDLECQGQDIKTVHMHGIAMLFERVGQKVLADVSSSLYALIFVHLQVPSLMSKKPMKCLDIPEAKRDTSNPVLHLAMVVAHCADFYRAARQITTSNAPPAAQKVMLVKVLQQALKIAQGLAAAEAETMPPQQTTEKRPEGQTIAAFDSQWTAATWSFFSSCMIVFFTMVHKCSVLLLGLGPLEPQEKQLAETTAGISDMALKKTILVFCKALPYVFGEVDAKGQPRKVPRRQTAVMYHMVWPLSVAIASTHSTPQQVAVCQTRLDMIRDIYGVKLAWYSVGLARDVLGFNDVDV
ncbi:uncharacterized protein FIESC28_02325 [Fusarium coffeatum]|uniref:Zn(2)-C6 fungal-type domain-containing protein n=1 Tax=Fusarium coffeatum TaxID=231269 RepID=A0A366S6E9_9HYPO|nr:uncharacterized protein FIESC28_02325 [Fusarium coffeatum]RBR24907.1 hypothetical protein FIESC28_02325 [Fusarium coffeatum]